MHVLHHPVHQLHGTGRAGHDAGAQRSEVEAVETRVLELGDEHGRHTVQGRAVFGCNRFQHSARLECIGREHGRRSMGHASEAAHYHAKTVIQRHRDAQAVPLRKMHARGDLVGIVENIVVSYNFV